MGGFNCMKSFSSMHPVVLFTYYVTVIFITMFMMHPAILVLSLLGSLIFFSVLVPFKQFMRDIIFYLFVFLLIALTNPLFVHNGETILFFLNDNPVTKEAIIYGIVIGTMLVAVIFWSKSYTLLMTSDKFIYLFGKVIPKLSLIISMAIRFIPLFRLQMKKVNQTQKTLGIYTSKSVTDRILSGVRTFNSLLTWSLENSITQADSMKARGYGLKGRTNFSIFKWNMRDYSLLLIIIATFSSVMILNVRGIYTFNYYPVVSGLNFSIKHLFELGIIFILMILPTLVEVKENLQWYYFKSKI